MILADTAGDRRQSFGQLASEFKRRIFTVFLKAMAGHPVTIRLLLDPPLARVFTSKGRRVVG
jgi:hypothetical protein